jgi:tetratricopeptide (TPR) repeat protein
MKLRFYSTIFLLFAGCLSGKARAQEQEFTLEGLMKIISKDSVLTIDITSFIQAPKVKQKVDVTKKFTMGRMQGTVGIASGQVTYFDKKIVKVQVLEYKSTVVENGVKGHLIKPGDITVLTWTDKLVPTYDSEQKRAQKLIDEDRFAEALPILDSLVKVKPQEEVLLLRGYSYFSLENYQAAIDDVTRVLATNPKEQDPRLIRELSYARMEKYEEALKDNEVLLSQATDSKGEIRHLKDQVYLVNKLENLDDAVKKERFCKISTRLNELDSKEMNYYNDRNYYCNTYAIAEDRTNYIPLQVVTQSTNRFKLTTVALKKNKYDWYGKSMNLNRKIPVGTYVNLEEIGEGYSMTIAIAKVTKVEGDNIELEIMYWGVRINNEPVMNDLSDGTTDILISW